MRNRYQQVSGRFRFSLTTNAVERDVSTVLKMNKISIRLSYVMALSKVVHSGFVSYRVCRQKLLLLLLLLLLMLLLLMLVLVLLLLLLRCHNKHMRIQHEYNEQSFYPYFSRFV
uniref:Uncharacterized protein n=1 Tax=Anopheles culicifacies TaxID=139723 RepID=A0A182M297_9DIPT